MFKCSKSNRSNNKVFHCLFNVPPSQIDRTRQAHFIQPPRPRLSIKLKKKNEPVPPTCPRARPSPFSPFTHISTHIPRAIASSALSSSPLSRVRRYPPPLKEDLPLPPCCRGFGGCGAAAAVVVVVVFKENYINHFNLGTDPPTGLAACCFLPPSGSGGSNNARTPEVAAAAAAAGGGKAASRSGGQKVQRARPVPSSTQKAT